MKFIDVGKLTAIYQKLSKREKIILYVTSSLIAIVLMDQLIVGPILKSIRATDQLIIDLENNIQKSVRLLGQKDQMTKEAEYYASYMVSSKSEEEGTLVLLKQALDAASYVLGPT